MGGKENYGTCQENKKNQWPKMIQKVENCISIKFLLKNLNYQCLKLF